MLLATVFKNALVEMCWSISALITTLLFLRPLIMSGIVTTKQMCFLSEQGGASQHDLSSSALIESAKMKFIFGIILPVTFLTICLLASQKYMSLSGCCGNCSTHTKRYLAFLFCTMCTIVAVTPIFRGSMSKESTGSKCIGGKIRRCVLMRCNVYTLVH